MRWIILFAFLGASCRSLNSATYIQPGGSFLLGNNAHGPFRVRLVNESRSEVFLYQAGLNGEKEQMRVVGAKAAARLSVPANTAIRIENRSADTASIRLRVKGDTDLGMRFGQ